MKRLYMPFFNMLWWSMGVSPMHRWHVQDLSVCDTDWHLPRQCRQKKHKAARASKQGSQLFLHAEPTSGERPWSRQDKIMLLQTILLPRDSMLNSCQLPPVEINLEPKMNQTPKFLCSFEFPYGKNNLHPKVNYLYIHFIICWMALSTTLSQGSWMRKIWSAFYGRLEQVLRSLLTSPGRELGAGRAGRRQQAGELLGVSEGAGTDGSTPCPGAAAVGAGQWHSDKTGLNRALIWSVLTGTAVSRSSVKATASNPNCPQINFLKKLSFLK